MQAVPGNLRRADTFVLFLKRFAAHVKKRMQTEQVSPFATSPAPVPHDDAVFSRTNTPCGTSTLPQATSLTNSTERLSRPRGLPSLPKGVFVAHAILLRIAMISTLHIR
eukprot:scaffold83281_cov36-Tisochrysis_lutea.AAC.5